MASKSLADLETAYLEAGGSASAGIRTKAGRWVHGGVAVSNAAMTLDTLYLIPILLDKDSRVDMAAVNIAVASALGGIVKGAIYDDDDYYPGVPLWSDNFAADAVAIPEKALNVNVPKLFWAGGVAQVAAPNASFCFGASHLMGNIVKPGTAFHTGGLALAAISGALPNPFPAGAVQANGIVRLSLRVA